MVQDANPTTHPSKEVFKKLSSILNISEIECYTLFLDKSFDFHLNFNSLSQGLATDSNIAKNFYGKCNETPKFFNFKDPSSWSTLNQSLMPDHNHIVACYYEKKIQGNGSDVKYVKIFDESTAFSLFHYDETMVKHVFLVTKKDKKNDYHIKYYDTEKHEIVRTNRRIYANIPNSVSPLQSESRLILYQSLDSYQIHNCLNHILKLYIEKEWKSVPSDRSFTYNEKSSGPKTIPIVQKITDDADYELGVDIKNIDFNAITSDTTLFNHINRPIVMCYHVGTNLQTGGSEFGQFSHLASFNEQNLHEPIVIVITLNRCYQFKAYIPLDNVKDYLLKNCITSTGRINGVNDHMKQLANLTTVVDEKNEKQQERVEKWWSKSNCHCDCCLLAKSQYSNNISIYGPQPRMGIELDTIEYLKIFNLDTQERTVLKLTT